MGRVYTNRLYSSLVLKIQTVVCRGLFEKALNRTGRPLFAVIVGSRRQLGTPRQMA